MEAAARELEGFKRLKPGKRQALPQQERAMCRQMQQRLTARKLARELEGFKRFKGFECRLKGKRGLCAKANALQQRLTARGLGGSCREGIGGF